MSTRETGQRLTLLQGTLDLPILRAFLFGPQHGQAIAHSIPPTSRDELLVEYEALFPALQRREAKCWIVADGGTSHDHRKARFYTLTKAGRKQLAHKTSRRRRLERAIGSVLDAGTEAAS